MLPTSGLTITIMIRECSRANGASLHDDWNRASRLFKFRTFARSDFHLTWPIILQQLWNHYRWSSLDANTFNNCSNY